jgi:hypothetical protein
MFKSSEFTPATGESFTSKIMNPGTHKATILDVALDVPPYDTAAYSIVLTLVGEDLGEGFEGIDVDKHNPAMGKHAGQIANVRSGRYPFSTFTYQGKEIGRDEQMFRWVNNLAKQMGVLDQMNGDNVEAENIEDYVAVVKGYLVNPELWGHFVIGGAEYFTEGYDRPNYRLFFPKNDKKLFPYSALNDHEGNPMGLLDYDETKHIIKKVIEEAAPVASFSGQAAPASVPAPGAFGQRPAPGAPAPIFNSAPFNAATSPSLNKAFPEETTTQGNLDLP